MPVVAIPKQETFDREVEAMRRGNLADSAVLGKCLSCDLKEVYQIQDQAGRERALMFVARIHRLTYTPPAEAATTQGVT